MFPYYRLDIFFLYSIYIQRNSFVLMDYRIRRFQFIICNLVAIKSFHLTAAVCGDDGNRCVIRFFPRDIAPGHLKFYYIYIM